MKPSTALRDYVAVTCILAGIIPAVAAEPPPLPVVWRVFSSMENWQSWNTVCENCCIITGDRMAENACFSKQKKILVIAICYRRLRNSEVWPSGIQLQA